MSSARRRIISSMLPPPSASVAGFAAGLRVRSAGDRGRKLPKSRSCKATASSTTAADLASAAFVTPGAGLATAAGLAVGGCFGAAARGAARRRSTTAVAALLFGCWFAAATGGAALERRKAMCPASMATKPTAATPAATSRPMEKCALRPTVKAAATSAIAMTTKQSPSVKRDFTV